MGSCQATFQEWSLPCRNASWSKFSIPLQAFKSIAGKAAATDYNSRMAP